MHSIQIHAIQTLPPNCINRGEHGEPKSARYGGVRRARVSSQSWKRAMRKTGFVEQETGQPGAVRSRRLLDHLKELLPEDKHDLAAQVIKDLYSAETVVLESKPIIDALVREVQTGSDAKAVVKAVATMPQVPDVAVYGRMIADYPSRNIDGALHVAHAISTHASMVDLDYFTAVDDLLPPGDTGAAHLDVAEFQAGTMYRYALLNLDQLHHNLEEPALVAPTVRGVLRAFVLALPTGHQAQYAAYGRPACVLAVVGEDAPVSLAGAFERPVRADLSAGGGYEAPSVQALIDHWTAIRTAYSLTGVDITFALPAVDTSPLTAYPTLEGWLTAVIKEAGL